VDVQLRSGCAPALLDELRTGDLDVAIVGLPAATSGLRAKPIAEQRAMAALPSGHPAATAASVDLGRLAPERLVVLGRDVNPAFHSAIVALCHAAGIAPALREIGVPCIEEVLLAVAAGHGLAVLPEAVADRHAMPGVRLVPIGDAAAAFRVALVTRPDADHLATHAFVRAIARARHAALATQGARSRHERAA
jgi:DNA-binding transcriptional LysR family regulator